VDGQYVLQASPPAKSMTSPSCMTIVGQWVPIDAEKATFSFYARSLSGNNKALAYLYNSEGPVSVNRRTCETELDRYKPGMRSYRPSGNGLC